MDKGGAQQLSNGLQSIQLARARIVTVISIFEMLFSFVLCLIHRKLFGKSSEASEKKKRFEFKFPINPDRRPRPAHR